MLSLTHAARQHVADLLSQARAGEVLRISAAPEGIRFAIDRVRIGDNTFNDGDRCILAVDQMVLRSVTGKTLDVETDDGKRTLVLLDERPSVQNVGRQGGGRSGYVVPASHTAPQ